MRGCGRGPDCSESPTDGLIPLAVVMDAREHRSQGNMRTWPGVLPGVTTLGAGRHSPYRNAGTTTSTRSWSQSQI
jgi:hypothetical protein